MLLAQRYGLAINGVLARQNKDPIYLLGGAERSSEGIEAIKNGFVKWWDIKNAEDCRNTVQWLYEEGHSASFEEAAARVGALMAQKGPRFQLESLTDNQELIAASFGKEIGGRALVAWDAGRLVHIAGWGYVVGYLEELEAWQIIVNCATICQRAYSSWAEFGHHYMLGRAFWGGHDPKIEATIKKLLEDGESAWVCVPWNTEIAVPGIPAKLGPHWSKIAEAYPARPAPAAPPLRIEKKNRAGKLIRHVDGADLVEEDGKRTWYDCHGTDIARDQVPDDWGPIQRDMTRFSGMLETLDEVMLHFMTFKEAQERRGGEAAEKVVTEFGYRSVGHYYRVLATAIKHYATPSGSVLTFSVFDSQDCQNAMRKASAQMLQRAQQAALGANPALTAPILGITLDVYALLSAKQAAGVSGDEFNALLAQHGLDLAGYQKVAAGWVERTQKDSTGMLARRYAELYMQNSSGTFAAAGRAAGAAATAGVAASGAEPIPFEKYCEITGAMVAWGETGVDANTEITKVFGVSMLDYGNIASFWSTKLATDQKLMSMYGTLVDKHTKQYGGGAEDEDDDLDEDDDDVEDSDDDSEDDDDDDDEDDDE